MDEKQIIAAIKAKAAELNNLFEEARLQDLYIDSALSKIPINTDKAPSVKLCVHAIYRRAELY